MDVEALKRIDPSQLYKLPDNVIRELSSQVLAFQEEDRRENQLLYYVPVSAKAQKVHESKAHTIGVGGGNGSSKTETCLVDMVMCATGVFPLTQRHLIDQKFRGPVNCRIVLQSLKTTKDRVLLAKLRWWHWTGLPPLGGDQGHWGWIPKECLKDRSWQRSWSEKYDTLTVLCRDPHNFDTVLGYSAIQIMSHDQEAPSAASGDFHHILLDEPPKYDMWRENQARAMRVNGQIKLAMTWPDQPGISVDWIFDEIYDRGVPGANKSPDVDWFRLNTLDNKNLDQESVRRQMSEWSEETSKVRIFGGSLRFSNLIHPLFTDIAQTWCLTCQKICVPAESLCGCERQSEEIAPYCHVAEFDHSPHWPTVFLLDPHPRKPHMYLWAQVDPYDDVWIVAEGELAEEPMMVCEDVDDIEGSYGFRIAQRLMDPNMGASPSSAKDREQTWQDEFSDAGLRCDLASDSDVGRGRINEYLKPDQSTRTPRIHVHSRCENTIRQLKRYSWDEHRRQDEREAKQTPRPKNDDYPTLIKYLMNADPSFQYLHDGPQVISRPGTRRSGY